MEKKSKIILTIFFAIALVFISIVMFSMDIVSVSPGDEAISSSSNVKISRLNVNATVRENGCVDVVETFDMKFNVSGLHEVVRFIPYACYQYREIDGKVQKNVCYAQITNLSGFGLNGEVFNTYVDEIPGYITFGLKDQLGFSSGETRTFTIGYSYFMGNDKNRGFDDVYYNLVGTNSTCKIENVTFSVSLPEAIPEDRIQMYKGTAGSTLLQSFVVSENVISGSCALLKAGEGITFRAIYEDGYLKKVPAKISTMQIVSIFLALGCVVVALVCFLVLRQRKDYPVPVELVPFDGLDPFVADYMANDKISTKTISASVICLAKDGYITIEDKGDNKIVFHKTKKDASEIKNATLRAVYNAILSGAEEKEMSGLGSGFATSVGAIQQAETVKQKSTLYDQKAGKKFALAKFGYILLMFLSAIMVFNIPKSFFGYSTDLFNYVNIAISVFLVYDAILCFFAQKNLWIYNLVSSVIFAVYLALIYSRFDIARIDSYCIGLVVLVLISALPFFVNVCPKYNKAGAICKGRVLGFKNYIAMCEVSQIKMFANENPNYYFDVLPYAYLFGLSKVWMEKFKDIEVKAPEWVVSSNGTVMDYVIFNSMFNSFNSKMAYTIQAEKMKAIAVSAKSFTGGSGRISGGGGSFGGGGFSGGGGGGGGFGAR